jgi:excisionase family DNA binding protein
MVQQRAQERGFLTVAEVAGMLRVSSMTVYRLIKAGDIRALRVGKSYRVPEEEIDRYLAAGFTQAG